jgi:hypothetical protein
MTPQCLWPAELTVNVIGERAVSRKEPDWLLSFQEPQNQARKPSKSADLLRGDAVQRTSNLMLLVFRGGRISNNSFGNSDQ